MSESVRRAAGLLAALAHQDQDVSVRDLAAQVDMSKSAVQRTLGALVEAGLATQDPVSRRYALGPLTVVLGTAYQRRLDLRTVALPAMTALRDATGETVGLSVAAGDTLLHIAQVEATSGLRRTFEIGRPLPLWCGAPSRVLLADRADDEVRRVASERRAAGVVPAAPPSASALLAGVRACREEGFAIALEETIVGVNTLAAPVRSADGRVAATLSVTGPASRVTEPALRALVPDLHAATATVSRALGHDGRPDEG